MFCELCSGDHPTKIFLPIDEEDNYIVNQLRSGKYPNKKIPRNNNSNQGWRFKVGPSHTQPYEHYTQAPPQYNKTTDLKDTLNHFMYVCMVRHKKP